MTRRDDHAGEPSPSHLLAAAGQLGGHVLTAGDLMLDIFAYGTIERISPEAPVPVFMNIREHMMAGGAGNVARNISALGGKSSVVGVTGNDEAGRLLARELSQESGVAASIQICPGRQTTTKRRYVASSQQILRVDCEDLIPICKTQEEALFQRFLALLAVSGESQRVAVIVLSDYGKGALPETLTLRMIEAANQTGCPVVVDTKSPDFRRYTGAGCMTPNAAELTAATGFPAVEDGEAVVAAQALIDRTGFENVLVTRGAKGMTLVSRAAPPVHLRSHRREIYDVSGAGDTVTGTLALAIASGLDWTTAAGLANFAAGVVVSRLGTATCSRIDLESEILRYSPSRIQNWFRRLWLPISRSDGAAAGLVSGLPTVASTSCIPVIFPCSTKPARIATGLLWGSIRTIA